MHKNWIEKYPFKESLELIEDLWWMLSRQESLLKTATALTSKEAEALKLECHLKDCGLDLIMETAAIIL